MADDLVHLMTYSIRCAKLDVLQPGAVTVTYGDESVTIHPKLSMPEFQHRVRMIQHMILQCAIERAQTYVPE